MDNEQTKIETIETSVRETFGLSKDFTAKAEEVALKTKAEAFVNALISGESTSNQKQEAIFALGAAEQQKLIDMGKGFHIRLKDLKQGEEGNEVAQIIEKLSSDFDRINPGQIDWRNAPRKGISKLLGKLPFIGNAISGYWEKYQDVMKVINEHIATLNALLDKKEKDILLINEKKDTFLKMMEEYRKTIVAGVHIKETLEERIAAEGDEEKKRFMQENWLYPLSKRLMNLQELYLSNFDAAISAELVARGHKELISDLREKNKVAMVRLQTGVWLAAELYDQKRLLESSTALKETNRKLADTVHSMLGTYQNEIQKEATDSFQSFEQWQLHMQQTVQLYKQAKDFRVNAIPVLNEKLTLFGALMNTAEKIAGDIEHAQKNPSPF